MSPLLPWLTAVAALGCAVTGGVFFAFSSFVMRALGRIPATAGLAAMQSINVVVINPGFMLAFLGSGAACVLASVLSLRASHQVLAAAALCRYAATLVYVLGSVGVTLAFNVPRNDSIAGLSPTSADLGLHWGRYLVEWTTFNHVRTLASLTAAGLLMASLALRGEAPPVSGP